MTCGFVQMAFPDLDPSCPQITEFVKNPHVVVITWSTFRSILHYYCLFSLSFLDVYSLSSSLWNLFLQVDLGLLGSSSDLIYCGVCLDKVQ